MNTVDILKTAKAKIADPSHWTQGSYARDANGIEIDETHPDAVSFCSIGAVYSVRRAGNDLQPVLAALMQGSSLLGVVAYNDATGRTHEEIMTLFDRAIKIAEGVP